MKDFFKKTIPLLLFVGIIAILFITGGIFSNSTFVKIVHTVTDVLVRWGMVFYMLLLCYSVGFNKTIGFIVKLNGKIKARNLGYLQLWSSVLSVVFLWAYFIGVIPTLHPICAIGFNLAYLLMPLPFLFIYCGRSDGQKRIS